ncbi:hypothetical protein D3C86_1558480 [compost metagenome]
MVKLALGPGVGVAVVLDSARARGHDQLGRAAHLGGDGLQRDLGVTQDRRVGTAHGQPALQRVDRGRLDLDVGQNDQALGDTGALMRQVRDKAVIPPFVRAVFVAAGWIAVPHRDNDQLSTAQCAVELQRLHEAGVRLGGVYRGGDDEGFGVGGVDGLGGCLGDWSSRRRYQASQFGLARPDGAFVHTEVLSGLRHGHGGQRLAQLIVGRLRLHGFSSVTASSTRCSRMSIVLSLRINQSANTEKFSCSLA